MEQIRTCKEKLKVGLFSPEEAEYWNNLIFPSDDNYFAWLELTKTISPWELWNQIGPDNFNAFCSRLNEDDPEIYYTWYSTSGDELPF